jgi:hypothetical protein
MGKKVIELQTLESKVLPIIFNDIQYWLDKAKEDIEGQKTAEGQHPGGQLIIALALFSYTEAMGKYVPPEEKDGFKKNNRGEFSNRDNFKAFFKCLDGGQDLGYSDFLDRVGDVYGIFRCGLVHNFLIEGMTTIAIPNDGPPFPIQRDPKVTQPRPVNAGVGFAQDGSYYLVLEKYFDDFKDACYRLIVDLKQKQITQDKKSGKGSQNQYYNFTTGGFDTSDSNV